MGSIPGSERSHGGGQGNPLQYSCLEKLLDRGAWWTTVHRVTKSQTQLSNLVYMHTYISIYIYIYIMNIYILFSYFSIIICHYILNIITCTIQYDIVFIKNSHWDRINKKIYQPHTSAKKKKIITLKKEIQEEIIVEYKRRVVVDSDTELYHPVWWS